MKNNQDLIHCFRCDAIYQKANDTVNQWSLVSYEGTSSNYKIISYIDKDKCPICRLNPLLTKPNEYRGAM